MIIYRYLCRELLTATFAVCVVLLLILINGRFVKYLAQAVVGDMEPTVIFAVIGYRVPGFLELTLPLAFFLSVMLAFGRLYVENEMSVLKACGVSEKRLLGYTLSVATVIALLVGWLSLSVAPSGMQKAETLLSAQKEKNELDKLQPKKFYSFRNGSGVTYVEDVTEQQELKEVFMAMSTGDAEDEDSQLVLVVAERGRQKLSGDGEQRYLVLDKGYRIEGIPGQHEYMVTRFEEYGSRIVDDRGMGRKIETDAIPTNALFFSEDLELQAALQWRFSIPLMVIVVTLLAVPLSRTNPRQGRFAKLLPAVFLYFAYLVSLNAARSAIESEALPVEVGLIPVHMVVLVIALLLLMSGRPKRVKPAPVAEIRKGAGA